MESAVIYELVRNNVYGALSRGLESLGHNAMGMLAERRASTVPPFKNDAFFYMQANIACFTVAALQKFCAGRLAGEDYYQARKTLMNNFEVAGLPFDEEGFKMFLPSYMTDLDHEPDEKKEEAYRFRFLDEFKTTLQVLDIYLRQNDMMGWSNSIMFKHIYDRLDQFVNPAEADKGFAKYPPAKEAQFFVNAARWLKQRSLAAQLKVSPLITMNTETLGGVFERVAGDTGADKMHLIQYAAACETMGSCISSLVVQGSYVPLIRKTGFSKKDNLAAMKAVFTDDIQVNMPQVLEKLVEGFRVFHLAHINNGEASDELRVLMAKGIEDMAADLKSEFIAPEQSRAQAAHRAKGKRQHPVIA